MQSTTATGIESSTPNATDPANQPPETSEHAKPRTIAGKKSTRAPSIEVTRKSIQTLQMLLAGIERTHGYLSKTVLAQHFAGTASKAVVGLRLERLAEFGLLKAWKKSHATQLIEVLIEQKLLSQIELKIGKPTIIITELGKKCIRDADSIPADVLQFTTNAWIASTDPESALDINPPTGKQRDTVWSTPRAIPPANPPLESATPAEPTASPTTRPSSAEQNTQQASANRDTVKLETDPTDTVNPEFVRGADKLPQPTASDAAKEATNQSILADWQWTLRLVRHGYRLGECALIRGKTPDGVLADLTIALQMDENVPLDHLFDTRTLLTIQELASHNSLPDRPPTMLMVFSGLWDFVQQWLKTKPD
ncbi:MAG: RQC domain-containing protein [Planctomycetota bacterium]